MRLKELLTDRDDAVSPVIGVILMVAITVILAAVIASFVLGLGPGGAAPTVNFDSSYDSGADELTIEVAGGDTVPADQISLSGEYDDTSGSTVTVDDTWVNEGGTTSTDGGESVIQSGNSLTYIDVGSSYEIDVVWTSEDGGTTQTLTTVES